MNNVILFLIIMTSSLQHAMEQNNPAPFPYEQLLPDLKGLVLEEIAVATNPPEAIKNFKNLLFTSKQFNTEQVSNVFLNALSKQFPEQEVRIAKLLNTRLAKNWLNASRLAQGLPAYTPKKRTYASLFDGRGLILNKNITDLKKWLEEGYNPTDLVEYTINTTPINAIPCLELLTAYGANLNVEIDQILSHHTHSLLFHVIKKRYRYIKHNLESNYPQFIEPIFVNSYSEIINYLIKEGAQVNPGEEKSRTDLEEKTLKLWPPKKK